MGGENPYLGESGVRLPVKPYTVVFMPMNVTVRVDPDRLPVSNDGRPGSLLQVAQSAGIEIDHACGGVCACSTCHVWVTQGAESLNEPSETEEDMLDNAPSLRPDSRLACQAVPDGSCDVVCEIPNWNRNLVKESHG